MLCGEKGKMVIFHPRVKKGENEISLPMMLHDRKDYVNKRNSVIWMTNSEFWAFEGKREKL